MATDSFASVSQAFAERVADLKRLALLRVSDSARDLYKQDMASLDANLRALEAQLRDIKAFVARERQAIPKVQALLQASDVQRQHLQYIASHLPQHLPSLEPTRQPPTAAAAGAGPAAGSVLQARGTMQQQGGSGQRAAGTAAGAAGAAAGGDKENRALAGRQAGAAGKPGAAAAGAAAGAAGAAAGGAGGERQRPPPKPKAAPKRYITQAELASLPAYMRGPRLTLERANGALDELAAYAEANARTVAAARGNARMADRKAATALLHDVAMRDGIRGHHWFLESDCRAGKALKLDKSGRALLAALRALGRLTEHRVTVAGARDVAYVLV